MLDALDAIHRFQAAFAELEFDAAYALIAEALESDPITTWHRIVQHHSSDFFRLVEFLDRRREMADLLEGVYARAPDMIDVPPSSTDPDLPAKLKRQRLDNIEKGLPYFLMASQGKSGSISFGNIVPAGFSLTCTTYSMIHLAVIPSWARDYARGGASYNTHLLPTKTNIDALRQAGLTRIVVHTRDPRQIYLSVLHHQNRYRSAYPEKQASGSFSLSLPDQALAEIGYFDEIVDWISGWTAAEGQGLTILFTTFEQFVENKAEVVDSILQFYGGEMRHFDRAAAFATHSKVDYHFRLGEREEWRKVLDGAVIDRLNMRVPNTWFEKFGWRP